MARGVDRRKFLLGTAAGFAAQAAPALAQLPGAGAHWFFLTDDEAAFLWAAMSRLVPGDELSPSAAELGGVVFLDRQLASRWGEASDWYLEGPWAEGTPQQGYQLPYTPRELYRRAIAALQEGLIEATGRRFQELGEAEQITVLTNLEASGSSGSGALTGSGAGGSLGGGDPNSRGGAGQGQGSGSGMAGREGDDVQHATLAPGVTGGRGEVMLNGVPGAVLFERLLTDTKWSYLADPAYGGNEDAMAWAMLGFPGAHAYYNSVVDNWSMDYDRPPSGIATDLDPYGIAGDTRFPTYDGPLDEFGLIRRRG